MLFAGFTVFSGGTCVGSDSVAIDEAAGRLDACSVEDGSGFELGVIVVLAVEVVAGPETWLGSRSPISPMAQTSNKRFAFFPTAGFYLGFSTELQNSMLKIAISKGGCMAKCNSCGKEAGFGESLCKNCDPKALEAAAAESARRKAEGASEVQRKMDDWRNYAKTQFDSGSELKMYNSIYLEVDSLSDGQQLGVFSIASLQAAGLQGWKVIAVVPRTAGIGLANKETQGFNTSTVWGGGMGGNVIGVYLLLEKPIKTLTSPLGEWAQELAQELIEDGFDL